MNKIVEIILLSVLSLQGALAQQKIDSVSIKITDLWVHQYSHYTVPSMDIDEYIAKDDTISYNVGYAILEDSIRNDTLVLIGTYSPPTEITFNADTSRATVSLKYRIYLWAFWYEIRFANAPVLNTESAYIIDMDSALLTTSGFFYSGFYSTRKSGGEGTNRDERSSDTLLASTRSQSHSSKPVVQLWLKEKAPRLLQSILTRQKQNLLFPCHRVL